MKFQFYSSPQCSFRDKHKRPLYDTVHVATSNPVWLYSMKATSDYLTRSEFEIEQSIVLTNKLSETATASLRFTQPHREKTQLSFAGCQCTTSSTLLEGATTRIPDSGTDCHNFSLLISN